MSFCVQESLFLYEHVREKCSGKKPDSQLLLSKYSQVLHNIYTAHYVKLNEGLERKICNRKTNTGKMRTTLCLYTHSSELGQNCILRGLDFYSSIILGTYIL